MTCTLRAGLDAPPPEPLVVGDGTALALTGWCFHPQRPIRRLELLYGERAVPAVLVRIQRRELSTRFPDVPRHVAEWSGFAAVLPIAQIGAPETLPIQIRATLAGGRAVTAPLTQVNLAPSYSALSRLCGTGDGSERKSPRAIRTNRIVICMTTYNPPPELFARQIASIRAQTADDWVCIISDDGSRGERFAAIRSIVGDDPRFRIHRQPTNRGYYRNFETCLTLVPPEAEFVALADQDDVWHRDKLAVLRSAFGPKTNLVYSDMRIVTVQEEVVSPTYWTTRKPNIGHLGTLLIANTVTGAAAMIRRRALDTILPFPPPAGAAFHDHWIACAALATGKIRYIDEPLYDYVQHGGNVIGHFAPPVFPLWTRAWRWMKFFWPPKLARNIRIALGNGRTHFFDDWLRVQQIATALRVRLGWRMPPDHRRALDRALNPLWLALIGSRHASGLSTTVGMEFHMLHARAWMLSMRAKAMLCEEWIAKDFVPANQRQAA